MILKDVRVPLGREAGELGPWSLEGPDDRPWLILGPSGSGKTSLLKVLTGHGPFRGGVEGAPPRDRCVYVPQFPERVLVGRNLAEDLSGDLNPGSETRADLRRLLRETGLNASLHREARTLSGGERRRLLMALMLKAGWTSWGWDEPEAGLDVIGRGHLMTWLRGVVAGEGGPYWVATGSPWMYLDLNPYCVVLDRGRLAFAGSRDEALGRREVRSLMGVGAHPAQKAWNDIGNAYPNLGHNVWKKLSSEAGPLPQLQVVLRDSEVRC